MTGTGWADQFDAVVMLTWSNWKTEMRSNRYHYASRFARSLPVLFVQADIESGEARFEPTELARVDLLHVSSQYGRPQTLALERALAGRGIRRPLLWVYNVYFDDAIARSAARLIAYHATEDFFNPDFLINPGAKELGDRVRGVLAGADLVVAVSDGVRDSYRIRGGYNGPIVVAANGCDFAFWRADGLPPSPRADVLPAAVYQGGISHKVDFALLESVALAMPDWEFWFAGDVVNEFDLWARVRALPNVKYHGVLRPDELRDLVHAATVGLIPFRQNDWITKRSWPLKAFEYVASGLPVVTVPIDALARFPEVFTFARDAGEFVSAIRRVAPSRRDPDALRVRMNVARAQDYDARFGTVADAISNTQSPHAAARARRATVRATADTGRAAVATLAHKAVGLASALGRRAGASSPALRRALDLARRSRSTAGRLRRAPKVLAKLTATYLLLARQPRARALLRACVKDRAMRSNVGLSQLLSDLMRVAAVPALARAARMPSLRTTLVHRGDGIVELRSRIATRPVADPAAPWPSPSVTWDYRGVARRGRVLRVRPTVAPVAVTLPPEGVYEFSALSKMLPTRGDAIVAVLEDAVALQPEPARRQTRQALVLGADRHPDTLSVLLLCDDDRSHANTVLDHIDGLVKHSRHHIVTFNPVGVTDSRFLDIDSFDVLVIHWSLAVVNDHHLSATFQQRIADFQGLKVEFIQDDYRDVDHFASKIRAMGTHILFTLVPEQASASVWSKRLPGVDVVTNLAGYVPERLRRVTPPPIADRPIDIGYRGRVLPFYLGEVAQEKSWIADGVLELAPKFGLRCDIATSEGARIYGKRWNEFIASCRSMLGSESGATIFDFDGSAERLTKQYLATHPGASFSEVQRAVLAPYEGNIEMRVVSPRVFEAIAWKTALIQFPGEYSGVIRPWEHYIPLERDFSNFAEVAACLKDVPALTELTERAYSDVIASGRYSMRSFVETLDARLRDAFLRRIAPDRERASPAPWTMALASFETTIASPSRAIERRLGRGRGRPLDSAVKAVVAVEAVLRTADLRPILLDWARHRRGRVPIAALLRDLFKIFLIREAQRGGLPRNERFVVAADVEDDTIRLTSQLPRDETERDLGWTSAERTLRQGRVRSIIWDHSPVGYRVDYRSPLGLRVGVGGEGGRNELTSLEIYLAERPDLVADALRPVGTEGVKTASSLRT